jgi:hypothetical protein
MKLYIIFHGNKSKGIWRTQKDIECPFERNIGQRELELFKRQMVEIYQRYHSLSVSAAYEFELKHTHRPKNI